MLVFFIRQFLWAFNVTDVNLPATPSFSHPTFSPTMVVLALVEAVLIRYPRRLAAAVF